MLFLFSAQTLSEQSDRTSNECPCVLCRHAKFHPNKTTLAMLQYRSLNWRRWSRRIQAEWRQSVEIKFQRDILIPGSRVHSYFRFCCAILEFHLRFRFLPMYIHRTCHFASACQIPSKSNQLRRRYDVKSISQDGGSKIGNLLVASSLVIALVVEGWNLFARHISVRSQSKERQKTTTSFEKRVVAILELYFWFWFWPLCI